MMLGIPTTFGHGRGILEAQDASRRTPRARGAAFGQAAKSEKSSGKEELEGCIVS